MTDMKTRPKTGPRPKDPRNPRLTRKQVTFIKEFSKGKTGEAAALASYNTQDPNIARSIASENLTKPNIREAIDKELERQGITIEKAIEPVRLALEANKQTTTIMGNVVDTGVPDVDMRLKGHDRAMKLMGVGREEATTNMFFANNIDIGKEFVK